MSLGRSTLDLHGMNHNDAIIKSEDFLLELSCTRYFDGILITGNSKVLQNKIIKEVLEKHDFSWYIPSWNQGQIIVSQ